MKFKLLIAAALCSSLLTGCNFEDQAIKQTNEFIAQQKIDKTNEDWKTKLTLPEKLTFSEDKQYIWQLKTNLGDIDLKLYHDTAPMHVSSTIYLTKLGFYDNLIFHRVIPGFMAQGGDPLGNGTGNPGYRYGGEFSKDRSHDKEGILSMANAGPNTDGSQFFITYRATPFLDGRHTVFGEVIKGMEVVKEMEKLGSRRGQTKEEIKILSAAIRVDKQS